MGPPNPIDVHWMWSSWALPLFVILMPRHKMAGFQIGPLVINFYWSSDVLEAHRERRAAKGG